MITIDTYVQNTLLFTNSLVIRLLDTAIAINKGLVKKYDMIIPEDRTLWKYFLNVSGVKHSTNNDVKITIIETAEIVSLTKDILELYQYTKHELLKNGIFYTELVNNYPEDIMYIHGCMYPVDINKAISSEDGTVLAYNNNYIDSNEYTIIKELEKYIKGYLQRWHVISYSIVDELYYPALLAILYANIPSKIINIRLSNIYTIEVDSFNLEHFFRSHLDIWDDIQILKKETIFWLYKNLKYLIKHVGKEKTFKIILTKIFEYNNIGIGEYLLRVPNSTLLTNSETNKLCYELPIMVSTTDALNKEYILDRYNEVSIETLVAQEILTLGNKDVDTEFVINSVVDKATNQYVDKQKTKVLDINANKLFKRNGMDIFKVILDYWIYNVKNNNYSTLVGYVDPNISSTSNIVSGKVEPLINYVEPNTNQNFLVKPSIGLLMLLKILLRITGNENIKLTKLHIDSIISSEVTKIDHIYSKLWDDKYTSRLLNDIKANYPTINKTIINNIEFGNYISDILHYYTYIWAIDANSENSLVSHNIKHIFHYMLEKDEYILTDNINGLTIDELLLEHNVVYDISNGFNLEASLSSMIKTFTNITLNDYDTIKEIISSSVNILDKLTSYTLQIVSAIDDTIPINIYYNNTNNIYSKNGLVLVLDAELTPLEQEYTHILAIANDFRDMLTVDYIEEIYNNSCYCTKPIKGLAEIHLDKSIVVEQPIGSYNIRNNFVYDAIYSCYVDKFILNVTGNITQLESNNVIINTVASDVVYDTGISVIDTNINTTTVELQKIIDGNVSSYVGNLSDVNSSVHIEKELVYDILNIEQVDKFILDVNASIDNIYDELVGKLTIVANDVMYDSNVLVDNTSIIITNDIDIAGIVVDDNEDIIIDSPNMIVEIK